MFFLFVPVCVDVEGSDTRNSYTSKSHWLRHVQSSCKTEPGKKFNEFSGRWVREAKS